MVRVRPSAEIEWPLAATEHVSPVAVVIRLFVRCPEHNDFRTPSFRTDLNDEHALTTDSDELFHRCWRAEQVPA
jgi:hypothetical protein